MNLLILEEKERIAGDRYLLDTRKSLHIREVLKKKKGETLRAGEWNGRFGTIQLEDEDESKRIVAQFIPETTAPEESIFQSTVFFISVPRPPTVKKMLQFAGTVGIGKLFFFPAKKSEKSYLDSPLWKEENLNHELMLGMEQGCRTSVPEVERIGNLKSAILLSGKNKIFLDPSGNYLHQDFEYFKRMESLSIFIGPEGGFSVEEKDLLKNAGAIQIKISENILRSETALIYICSQLEITM